MTFRHSIFEIRPETWPSHYGDHARDQAVARIIETIDASTFPWWRCIPALRRNDRFPFPIEFMEPRDGADGYVSNNRMWLRPDGWGKPSYQTIAHELCHVADLATLGESFGQPFFNSAGSPWRSSLLQAATWNGSQPPKTMAWNPGINRLLGTEWAEHPIEAVSVPFTRAFWTDPKFYYSEHRFATTWTWPDVAYVRKLFLERPMQVFDDVPDEHTHAEAINWLAAEDIIRGFDEGSKKVFRPSQTVNRGQIATIVYNAIRHVLSR